MINSRLVHCSAGVALLISGTTNPCWPAPPPSSASAILPTPAPSEQPLGPPSCPWPSQSGQQLLDKPLGGPLTFSRATVADIVTELQEKHHLPLSFIESDSAPLLTFDLRDGTLRELLDRIVALAPVYHYRFVGARLVLYPVAAQWDMKIDLRIARGKRRWVGEALVVELRRRVPALATLNPPWTFGDPSSFVYQDEVAATGPASLVALFTQVLGDRPSASFMVSKLGGEVTTFFLTSEALIRSLDLTSPTLILHRPGDSAQLKLVATLYDGSQQVLTPAGCGTVYSTIDPKVLRTSSGGLVTAVGEGEGVASAISEDVIAAVTMRVEAGGKALELTSPASVMHPGVGGEKRRDIRGHVELHPAARGVRDHRCVRGLAVSARAIGILHGGTPRRPGGELRRIAPRGLRPGADRDQRRRARQQNGRRPLFRYGHSQLAKGAFP
jgi:hypothetical protein